MEREIEALLRRARAVLARHEGVRPEGRARGVLEAAELLALSRSVFYELGVASSEEGPIGRAALRLEGPAASPRILRVGIFVSKKRLVLATRWHPVEKRPLLVRGEPLAEAWSAQLLEHGLEARIKEGVETFEKELARGEGHLDSSGDLLGLNSEP